MSKKKKTPLYVKNFGVGKYISPVKEGKDKSNTDEKPKVTTKEYGKGDAKQGDKGWVKALKAGTTMLSHGIASVYGGTAHTPKINWGKRKSEIKAEDDVIDPKTIVDVDLDGDEDEGHGPNEENDEETPEMDFGSKAEGDEFRAWINKTYPDYAKEIDLDASGSHTNSYIKKAFEKYGGEYNKSSGAKMLSPLKARQSSRGGKHAGKATATGKRRGGFAKSTGKRGAGGRNVGGYNVQTRFKPRAAQPIKGGVSSGGGGDKQPYSFDKNGDMIFSPTIINNVNGGADASATASATATADGREWVPPEFETQTTKHESYKEAWERKKDKYTTKGQKSRMGTDENAYNVFNNFDEYVNYMERVKEYNKTEEGKEWSKRNRKSSNRTTTRRVKTKDGYWKTIPGAGGTAEASASASATTFKGKFNYGGYRTMHGK
jgi:hypothetical protein